MTDINELGEADGAADLMLFQQLAYYRHRCGATSRPESSQESDEAAAAGRVEVRAQPALTL